MSEELYDPGIPEFEAELAEMLTTVGIEINEYEKQYKVSKGAFIKICIDTKFCDTAIYRLTISMKVVMHDTSMYLSAQAPTRSRHKLTGLKSLCQR